MSANALATDAVHRRGCRGEEVRPSSLLAGYVYCPACQRLVREDTTYGRS